VDAVECSKFDDVWGCDLILNRELVTECILLPLTVQGGGNNRTFCDTSEGEGDGRNNAIPLRNHHHQYE
jgi:hypothetical protein